MAGSLLILACSTPSPVVDPTPEPTPSIDLVETAQRLPPSTRVAACPDGLDHDEAVLAQVGTVRWGNKEHSFDGTVQAMACGDTDGDGTPELWVATGLGRQTREATATVWRWGPGEAPESQWTGAGSRHQVTQLSIHDGKVWLAAFVDDRAVGSGWLSATWPQHTAPLALAQVPLASGAIAAGRMYGDEAGSDGDLHLVAAGDTRRLPSLRGVRQLLATDLDGDGRDELIIADGWHMNYGAHGDARVSLYSGEDLERQRVIAWLEGSYTVTDLHTIPTTPPAILAVGSHDLYLLVLGDLGWESHRLASVLESGNAVPIHTAEGWAALVAGEPTVLLPLTPLVGKR